MNNFNTIAVLSHWQDTDNERKEMFELEQKFLKNMSKEQLKMYDKLVQKVYCVGGQDEHDANSEDL